MTFVDRYPKSTRIIKAAFAVAFGALAIGGFFGLIQALHRTDVFRGFISSVQYYDVLTGHGVLLALVFTTFFILGLFQWGVSRSFDREPENMTFTWFWYGMTLVGTLMTTVAILGGLIPNSSISAAVLYTFYPPLQAHPLFYIGAALLVVGSWLAGADWFWSYRKWRAEHPEARIPLQAYMTIFTMLMWYICSLGVALEVVVLLIPWSMGWVTKIDPLLPRTLFWYFGHAVVYFWLLPAYFVWYTILPKLSGGRLFSDPLARIVFIFFLLLSTPIGYHHQYADPGISIGYKMWALIATLVILLPSLMTAFTVISSMEHGARQRGGSGYFAWMGALPWDRPAFAGCALAGIMFAAGGFSGMINASLNIDMLIHNTAWIPGHFHLTVGTASALTFMAITYWLLPQLTGRALKFKKLALAQPYLWFIGMTLMSNALHRQGLAGVPRRTAEPQYSGFSYDPPFGTMAEMDWQVAIGGTILFIALLAFLAVIGASWSKSETTEAAIDDTIPPPLSGPEHSPKILDNIGLWTAVAVVLVIIAYTVPLYEMVADGLFSPGAFPSPM
ncbi:b(o/a)3-type cytochrome-c oxidase subunit 1 [Salisaeta longa]|uniref:b(o/a)3-type cytochrome-c oxidase subunit 1 n=1 Tax=Salisaeta longa TaxID=503170 RepID=UPI0003B57139|nr:b(o/a)3-type cytochrome-c oxidase subunit 1 [Salisaeta longa]